MPRTLPWLQERAKAKVDKPASERPSKRQRTAKPDLVDDDLNTTGVSTPKRKAYLRPARTPSTSPPPAPPEQEYMREGYAEDDVYIMVEDEFLATAQQFTKHLHHAEYVRLKKLATARGNAAINSMTRAVDGRTAQSAETKLKLEADAIARNVKSGMRKVAGHQSSDEEEDEPWGHDPQLAGLMGRGRASGEVLTALAKAKPNTRASAGYSTEATRSPPPTSNVFKSFSSASKTASHVATDTSRRVGTKFGASENDNDDDDEYDDYDLDGKVKTKRSGAKPRLSKWNIRDIDQSVLPRCDTTNPVLNGQRLIGKFNPTITNKPMSTGGTSTSLCLPSVSDSSMTKQRTSEKTFMISDAESVRLQQSRTAAELVAKRKTLRERREKEDKRKAKRPDQVPTWLV